jgi:hypothetical protein
MDLLATGCSEDSVPLPRPRYKLVLIAGQHIHTVEMSCARMARRPLSCSRVNGLEDNGACALWIYINRARILIDLVLQLKSKAVCYTVSEKRDTSSRSVLWWQSALRRPIPWSSNVTIDCQVQPHPSCSL